MAVEEGVGAEAVGHLGIGVVVLHVAVPKELHEVVHGLIFA
ncbi:hypothetical protein [Streptomyces levis]